MIVASALLSFVTELPPPPPAECVDDRPITVLREMQGAAAGLVCDPLEYICARESNCRAIGRHAGDSHWADTVHSRAIKMRAINPSKCEHHRKPVGTIGPLGLMFEYHVKYLDDACVSPESFASPRTQFVIAVRKWAAVCSTWSDRRRWGWCSKQIGSIGGRVFTWGRGIAGAEYGPA